MDKNCSCQQVIGPVLSDCIHTSANGEISIIIIYSGCALGIAFTAILLLFVLLHHIQLHFYTMPRIERNQKVLLSSFFRLVDSP